MNVVAYRAENFVRQFEEQNLLRNLLRLAFICATENYVLQRLSADIKQGDCVYPNQTYFGVGESLVS